MKKKKSIQKKEEVKDRNIHENQKISWYVSFFSDSQLSSAKYHLIYLACISVIVFANTLHNAFQLDDFHSIVNNSEIRYIHPLWRHFTDPSTITVLPSNISYRPLLPLSLSLTYAVWGYNVMGYHIFNIIIHILAGCSLYFLFYELLTFQDRKNRIYYRVIAFTGALIFAIHPISGACVNYICGRDNPMMVFFLSLSFYLYIRMRKYKERPDLWIITLLLFLCSLMCKPMAVIFPLVILEFEIFIAGEKVFSKKTFFRTGVFFLTVTGISLFVKLFTSVFEISHGFIGSSLQVRFIYLMTQFKLHFFHYLRNFIWPFPIRGLPTCEVVTSPFDFFMLTGFFVISLSIYIAWRLRNKVPVMSFCILAYWTMFIPTSSILPVYQYVADRWMYPSLPYLSLIVAILIIRCIPSPKISLITLAVFILYLGISSFFMNYHWKNAISFYRQCARYGTDEIGYMNLGLCYRGIDEEKARLYMEKALEKNPNYYLGYTNLGLWYIDHGEKDRGLDMIKKGIEKTPAGCEPYSYYWYAKALENTGKAEEAFEVYKKLMDFSAGNMDIKHLYEAALCGQSIGKYREALEYLDMIHERTDNYGVSRFTAGWCHQSLKEYDEAIKEYGLAEKYTPDYGQIYSNVGYLYMELKEYEKAIPYFEKYLRIVPQDGGVKADMDLCKKLISR